MLLSGKARLAGVVGWPIGHSLSPRLHGHWFERYRIDGAYVPLAVAPEAFAEVARALPRMGFRGFNVTVPHKTATFALLAEHDEAARRMGAVNTVLIDADGGMRGLNTDGLGFLAHLRASLPSWRPQAAPAVVLGAGGAARAVAASLLEAGVPALRLVNRTAGRGHELAAWLGDRRVEVLPWAARGEVLAGAGLVVNTTSLGMAGQPPLEIALDALPAASPVYDLVYVPLETPLLAAARGRGHPAIDGLGMLIHQAVPGFTHWGGRAPEVDEGTRAVLLERLAA